MTTDALPRVLYLADLDPSIKFGSLEEQMLLLANAFRERESTFVPVYSAPPGGETHAAYQRAGIEAEWCSLTSVERPAAKKLLELIDRHRIDVVHWNFYSPVNPYWFASRLRYTAVKHFFTDHTSRPAEEVQFGAILGPVRRLLKERFFRQYHAVFCVTEFVRNAFVESGGPSDRSHVVPHFVNTDRFRPDPAAGAALRLELAPDADFVALAVAHLIPEKGIDVLIRALARLPTPTALWVVGDGAEGTRLRNLAEERGLGGRVRFFGNQSDVHRYMQAADCLVCPSTWHEAAGLVNIEALSSALPVVASRVGGIPEIVDDRKTGILVPPGDEEALASGLGELSSSRALRESMGREARRAALERFSPEARIPAYLALYAQALQS